MSGAAPALARPRVLVVEDDPDLLALLASHLRRLGCAVTLATTGEEALALAAAQPPQVAIVDILLPGIDGREVLDTLRTRPDTAACLLVATTVLDGADLDRRTDAVLAKPFVRRDVERVVGGLLDRLEGSRA